MLHIPVSIGEIFDKITILQLKKDNFNCVEKVKNVNAELNFLLLCVSELNTKSIDAYVEELRNVNKILWKCENEIRGFIDNNQFGQDFIDVSISIRKMNEKRNEIKKKINLQMNSPIVEEKEYTKYDI